MKKLLRRFISDQNAFLLFYHKLKAMLAALIYWYPANNLIVIGVTGTNGKTTTCNMITNLLMHAGHKVGMATSINFQVGEKRWDNKSKLSSQSPFVLQKLLRQMVRAGCRYAVIEVTSHSVAQSRIHGINFDVGVFTNISNDHLEYHGSFLDYMKAKGRFIGLLQGLRRKTGVDKVLVLNADDSQFEYFDQFQADRKYTFGLDKGTLTAVAMELRPSGTEFELKAPNQSFPIKMKMIGDFNVYNALAASSVCLALGLNAEQIQVGFEMMNPIPGRYEPIEVGQPYTVIADYAHTEVSLERLLSLFKSLTKGRVILVFGCTGGGRDKQKRPLMGKIADQHADLIVLTDDDPYEENRLEIIEMIMEGIDRKEGDGTLVVLVDRQTAIEYALEVAQPGDTVLIAGKGCEKVFAIEGKLIPWDDREIAKEVLARVHRVEIE